MKQPSNDQSYILHPFYQKADVLESDLIYYCQKAFVQQSCVSHIYVINLDSIKREITSLSFIIKFKRP